MSIRQLSFLVLAGLGGTLGAQAQSPLPAMAATLRPASLDAKGASQPPHIPGVEVAAEAFSLAQVLQAARQNLDVSQATRLLDAARADVQSADHAPLPVLSGKFSAIDLQNGVGGAMSGIKSASTKA
jgi:cobalt-zinc-cadmium efflux system outer membrane protein